jgi:hypothetical protein
VEIVGVNGVMYLAQLLALFWTGRRPRSAAERASPPQGSGQQLALVRFFKIADDSDPTELLATDYGCTALVWSEVCGRGRVHTADVQVVSLQHIQRPVFVVPDFRHLSAEDEQSMLAGDFSPVRRWHVSSLKHNRGLPDNGYAICHGH